jgi:hypothetical protein
MRIYEYARSRAVDPKVVALLAALHLSSDLDPQGEPDPGWTSTQPRTLDDLAAITARHGQWSSAAQALPDEVIPALDRLLTDETIVGPLREAVEAERVRVDRLLDMSDHGSLYRVDTAAAAARVDVRKVRVWMSRGRLPFYVLSDGKKYVFTRDILQLANGRGLPERVDDPPHK